MAPVLTAAELSFNYEPSELNWHDGGRASEIGEQAESLGCSSPRRRLAERIAARKGRTRGSDGAFG